MKYFLNAKRFLWAALCAVCMVLAGCADAKPADENKELWNTPDHYIASYGPVYEPYWDLIRNSYYLYDSSGQYLGRARGEGSWSPTAFSTKDASYGYFADSIDKLGTRENEATFLTASPVDYYDVSPEKSMAVAIVNDSNSAEFHHSFIVFHGDSTFKETLETVPLSLAVGEDAALVVGYSYEDASHKTTSKDLVLIRSDGSAKKIDFPSRFDINVPEFYYGHTNYLGDGLFEILEGRTEEDITHFKSFEIRISDNSEAITQNITYFWKKHPENFAEVWALPFGETGDIDMEGNVFISHRDNNPAEHTGKIEGFNKESFVRVYSPTEGLLGIRRDDVIEIRRWAQPEEVIARLPYEKGACFDAACGLAMIARTS